MSLLLSHFASFDLQIGTTLKPEGTRILEVALLLSTIFSVLFFVHLCLHVLTRKPRFTVNTLCQYDNTIKSLQESLKGGKYVSILGS